MITSKLSRRATEKKKKKGKKKIDFTSGQITQVGLVNQDFIYLFIFVVVVIVSGGKNT